MSAKLTHEDRRLVGRFTEHLLDKVAAGAITVEEAVANIGRVIGSVAEPGDDGWRAHIRAILDSE